MFTNHDPATGSHADTLTGLDSNHLPCTQALHLNLVVIFQTFLNNGKQFSGKAVCHALFQTVLDHQDFGNFLYRQFSHSLLSSL